MQNKLKKILLIRIGAIGDVVNSTIIHQAIKEQHPDCEIQFMTSDFIGGILKSDPKISKVWSFDMSKKDNIKYLFKLGLELRKENFDLIINLQKSTRTLLLKFLSGCKKQILRCKESGHSADVFFKSLDKVFAEIEKPKTLKLYTSPALKDDISKKIENLEKPLIAINPGGESDNSRQGRIWPLKNWEELSIKLLKKYGGTILILGSKAEKEYHSSLENIPKSKIFTGELSLEENMVLIEQSDLFISGDTGPLHIAGAVGTKVIGLYGSTPPKHCGPYAKINNCITANYDCVACGKRECIKNKDSQNELYTPCMKAISVEDVLSKVEL